MGLCSPYLSPSLSHEDHHWVVGVIINWGSVQNQQKNFPNPNQWSFDIFLSTHLLTHFISRLSLSLIYWGKRATLCHLIYTISYPLFWSPLSVSCLTLTHQPPQFKCTQRIPLDLSTVGPPINSNHQELWWLSLHWAYHFLDHKVWRSWKWYFLLPFWGKKLEQFHFEWEWLTINY